MRGGEQMQIVIAEQRLDAVTCMHAAAQHANGVGSAVHQVTQQVERIAAWGKVDVMQQSLECTVASLNVADEIISHEAVAQRVRTEWPCVEIVSQVRTLLSFAGQLAAR